MPFRILRLLIAPSILYYYTLLGCISPGSTNIPPTIKVSAFDSLFVNNVQTTLSGSVEGDSIISTLWICEDSSQHKNVYIEEPDSLVTRVFINKTGTYRFILWAQNVHNLLDSSHTTITVK